MSLPSHIIDQFRVEECCVFDLPEDCWNYYGRRNAKGYPTAYIDGRPRLLHRYVWEVLVGNIPDGMELDHLCRNPACCNPKHLEPVTGEVNRQRVKNPPHRLKEVRDYNAWRRFEALSADLVGGSHESPRRSS